MTTSTKISFKDYLVSFINNYIHITMFAIVLIYLSEKLLKNSLKMEACLALPLAVPENQSI